MTYIIIYKKFVILNASTYPRHWLAHLGEHWPYPYRSRNLGPHLRGTGSRTWASTGPIQVLTLKGRRAEF